MKKRIEILLTVALLVLLSATASAAPPNVVILFADDLGYGDLSSYGHPTIRTPNLDGLAAQGIRFTSFYSSPWCVPARIQLMTGKYPPRVDVSGGTGSGGAGGIPEEHVTLAQAFQKAGYRTGMMGKWHLGYQRDEYLPVGKGFDYWFGLPYSNDMQPPWVKTDVPLWLYENTKKVEHPVDQDTLTVRYTEHALDFIRESGKKPFLLYLAYSMPHLPVHTAERFRGRSRSGLYGDVIETIDWSAGEIMNLLREQGIDKNTIFVFTSDNGPWLNLPPRMLAGGVLPWHAGSPGPLRRAKHTTYEGGVRVPCIIRWPEKIEGGRTTAEMASTLDLHATLIKAAHGKLPDYELDGFDLMPLLDGSTGKSPRSTFLYFGHKGLEAVRSGAWKLRTPDGTELFNLELDPFERFNRAEEKPEIVQRLSAEIERMSAELPPRRR